MFTRRPIAYKPGDSEKWQRMYEEYHRAKNTPHEDGGCEQKESGHG